MQEEEVSFKYNFFLISDILLRTICTERFKTNFIFKLLCSVYQQQQQQQQDNNIPFAFQTLSLNY